MKNRSPLLSSKCEGCDSFLSFYSKTKGILHKLTKGNLIAIKDDVFLKVYFLMTIEATELQTEVKGFLRDTNTSYSETLELTHADFRVQTTEEHLRITTTRLGSTVIVRRGKTDDDINLKKTDVPVKGTGSFPNNHGKILPSEYYRQFGEWYGVFSAFKSERTPEQVTWIEKFKFNFEVAQHSVWPRNNQRNDGYHDRPSRQKWNSGGGGRKNSRNCGWDQGRDEHRSNNSGDRGNYPSNRIIRGNSTTCRRVRFDDPDRSPESDYSRGDKFYQNYMKYKRWKDENSSNLRRIRNEEQEDENEHKHRRLIFRG